MTINKTQKLLLLLLIISLGIMFTGCSKLSMFEVTQGVIKEFTVNNQVGSTIIDSEDKKVTVKVKADTDLTQIQPTNITVNEGYNVNPGQGEIQDFSQGSVTYTISSMDNEDNWQWQVEVIEAEYILSNFESGDVDSTLWSWKYRQGGDWFNPDNPGDNAPTVELVSPGVNGSQYAYRYKINRLDINKWIFNLSNYDLSFTPNRLRFYCKSESDDFGGFKIRLFEEGERPVWKTTVDVTSDWVKYDLRPSDFEGHAMWGPDPYRDPDFSKLEKITIIMSAHTYSGSLPYKLYLDDLLLINK